MDTAECATDPILDAMPLSQGLATTRVALHYRRLKRLPESPAHLPVRSYQRERRDNPEIAEDLPLLLFHPSSDAAFDRSEESTLSPSLANGVPLVFHAGSSYRLRTSNFRPVPLSAAHLFEKQT